jgi:chloramphenicol-sensitive protein RarD
MMSEEPTLCHDGETSSHAARGAQLGVAYGVAAYAWWGLCPIYFKAVASVPALQVLAHRIVWSVLLLLLLTVVQRRWQPVRAVCRDRRTLLRLCVTTLLIANNWGLFIWAVAHDHLLQASFGYFINPLVNVLLGFVFLRERLRRMQTLAVLLAAIGVAYLIFAYGQFPWIALVLALSFAFYGLLRKTARADALVGLTVETALLTPVALAFLLFEGLRGAGAFGVISRQMDLLLASAGIITAVPLLWFAAAAKRLWYSTLGILQYLAPTGQFLLAVLAYGEPFTRDHLISFSLIWTALIIYSVDTALLPRRSAYGAGPRDG